MRKHFRHFMFGLMVLGLVFGSASLAMAITITNVDGDWANGVGGSTVIINNDIDSTPGGTNDERLATAKWGANYDSPKSGYDFVSKETPIDAIADANAFELGDFTHLNYPITSGTGLDKINLLLGLNIEDASPVLISATFKFDHNETPNSGLDPRDIVTIENAIQNIQFTIGSTTYYLNLLGFSTDSGATYSTVYYTNEGASNTATLYAKITTAPVPEPATMLLLGFGVAGLAVARRFKK